MSKLLSPPEAASKLNVSLRWVRTAIFEQRFQVVKLGRLVRIEEDELDRFIEANRVPVNDERRPRGRPPPPSFSTLNRPLTRGNDLLE